MTSTEAHRQRRDRALVRTLVAGGVAQLATVVGQLVSLPFVARSLSHEEFGVYVTLSTLIVLLGASDLGVGSSLTTRLAVSFGREDAAEPRRLIASALTVTAILALIVSAVGVAGCLVLPLAGLLGTSTLSDGALLMAALAAVAVTATALVGSLGYKILYGMQRGGTANSWIAIAALVSAAGTTALSTVEAPVWAYLCAGPGVASVVALICLTWVTVSSRAPALLPRTSDITISELLDLGRSSGWFAVIALGAATAYQTDVLIVAGVLGAGSAGVYGVTVRIFGVMRNAVYPALVQLWPAFGEALTRGDVVWVRARLYRVVAITAFSGAMATGLLALAAPLAIRIWLSHDLTASYWVYAAMALWVTYALAIAPFFFLLNAAGLVRLHAVLTCLVAAANVPLSLGLANVVGIVGPIIGAFVSHALFAGIPAVIRCHRLLTAIHPIADHQSQRQNCRDERRREGSTST